MFQTVKKRGVLSNAHALACGVFFAGVLYAKSNRLWFCREQPDKEKRSQEALFETLTFHASEKRQQNELWVNS